MLLMDPASAWRVAAHVCQTACMTLRTLEPLALWQRERDRLLKGFPITTDVFGRESIVQLDMSSWTFRAVLPAGLEAQNPRNREDGILVEIAGQTVYTAPWIVLNVPEDVSVALKGTNAKVSFVLDGESYSARVEGVGAFAHGLQPQLTLTGDSAKRLTEKNEDVFRLLPWLLTEVRRAL